MNTIIRLIAVSFMISAVVFGIAGYAGSKSRSLPLMQAIEDLESSGAFMLQEIAPIADEAAASAITGLCFGDITISLQIGCGVADSNPL